MESNGRDQTAMKNKSSSNQISEDEKLGLLRSSLERHDYTSKQVDDMTLKRFLRARDYDIDKASALMLKYLKWRREFVPNGFISESDISYDLAHNKTFLQGTDTEGRPILVVFSRNHFPNKSEGGLEEFKRYIVYVLDKVCCRMPEGQEKFITIGDLRGWGYINMDIRGLVAALAILQDCYPERLEKLFLVNVPSLFMTAWKMIYPFIDNKTRRKITFVEKKKLMSTLAEYIDESQLPQIYGGKLPLVSIENT